MTSKILGRLSIPAEPLVLFIIGLCLLLAAALISIPAQSQSPGGQPPAIAGLWLDNEGKARVEIGTCGAEVCGSIVWLKDPLNPNGQPWTDILNPDKAKKTRPICGMQIIGGLKPATPGQWTDGWVYDPEEGKSFNLELSLKDPATLTVFGYAGIRLLSETRYWTRQPGNLPRCKA